VISGEERYFNYISNAFQKIFGFEIAIDDKKWHVGIKLHLDDFQKFIDKFIEIREYGSEFKFFGRLLFRSKVLWFETNATVTHKDGLIILNGIISNITERKEIEEEIFSKRKFNDSVLSNIPADIAVFDKDHNYQFINSNGIVNQDIRKWMIGKNDFDYCHFKGFDTKMAKERRAYFNKAKETKQIVDWIDEFIKNEKKVYIYRRFFPYFIDNIFVYMIGYGIDVTELREAQLQLEVQNKILINKNQELERFTYIASHDLQEPLLSLISFSKLLEDEYSEILDDDGKLFVEFINKSAIRMKSLVTGLMEYNRINKKENLDSFDFNILMKEAQDDLSDKINRYGAIIKTEKLPTLPCYPTFIRILFQNLISNAIKFTTKEVIPNIKISCRERKEDWLFQIVDNGIGINANNRQEIFMLFKRLHNKETYAGNGIGLAHCKKIVEIHNGEIWVESIEGVGSTFYFTISKSI
jgi:signal transduction histidine kinase